MEDDENGFVPWSWMDRIPIYQWLQGRWNGWFFWAQLCPSCVFYLMYVHVVSGLKAMALDVALSPKKCLPSHSVFNRLQVINLRWHRPYIWVRSPEYVFVVNNFCISEDVDQCYLYFGNGMVRCISGVAGLKQSFTCIPSCNYPIGSFLHVILSLDG